jgi:hypothetical protein
MYLVLTVNAENGCPKIEREKDAFSARILMYILKKYGKLFIVKASIADTSFVGSKYLDISHSSADKLISAQVTAAVDGEQ